MSLLPRVATTCPSSRTSATSKGQGGRRAHALMPFRCTQKEQFHYDEHVLGILYLPGGPRRPRSHPECPRPHPKGRCRTRPEAGVVSIGLQRSRRGRRLPQAVMQSGWLPVDRHPPTGCGGTRQGGERAGASPRCPGRTGRMPQPAEARGGRRAPVPHTRDRSRRLPPQEARGGGGRQGAERRFRKRVTTGQCPAP